MERYTLQVNQEVNESSCRLLVRSLYLYVFQAYNMVMYAIEIIQDGIDLDIITQELYRLRGKYEKTELNQSEYGKLLQPIVNVFESVNPKESKLLENGNKLKIFHIVEVAQEEIDNDRKTDELLLKLGTLTLGNDSMSSEYLDQLMTGSKISVYNNWKGLALFDTFTMIGHGIYNEDKKKSQMEVWKKVYFNMIYIHSLFLKFYLFRTNIEFRKKNANVSNLEKQFLCFERDCCFHKISYNFLPLEIYNRLNISLEINEEKTQLYHLIEKEKDRQGKERDRRMSTLLFILACLTIFSTIWDSYCLYKESISCSMKEFTKIGIQISITILLLIVVHKYRLVFFKTATLWFRGCVNFKTNLKSE